MTDIQNILRSFGITQRYKGFKYAEYALLLATEDNSRLDELTKNIYMPTGRYFGCSVANIERNIRTIIRRAWKVDRNRIRRMAGYPLDGAPSVSEFIEIVSSYILRNTAQTDAVQHTF